jgi:hypothetical protein
MRGALAALALLASCTTTHSVPQTPDDWRTYVHRWGHQSEAAVRVHLGRVWQCADDLQVKPAGMGSVVDDIGVRTPALEFLATGCGHDGRYLVLCPAPDLVEAVPAGKVACEVRHKAVVALGLPAVVSDVGGIAVVDDAH